MSGRTGGAGAGSRDGLRRLDALAQVGLRLARSAPSGRVLLAQLALGVDPRWVPRPWGEELLAEMDGARAAASEPLTRKQVERSLRATWDAKPTDELDDLEPEPVAVTPTSQVHRGERDGAPVAVKVQRPGLAQSVRQDLALLDSLTAPLAAAFPALDARAVLREIGERVRDEFDLEHEAANARQFHRRLRGHPRLLVPAPVTRLATGDVLVREWVEGRALTDTAPETHDAVAAALVEFVLGAGGTCGLMNAGLTAADVLVLADGRVAIVDHGTCATVPRDRLAPTVAAVQALTDADLDGFATALARLGWLRGDDPPTERAEAAEALSLLRDVLGGQLGPGATWLDADAVRDSGRRLLPRRDDAVNAVQAGALPPGDIWPLRGVVQLFGTIARLGASGAWPSLALRALQDGWEPSARRPGQ